MTTIKDTSFKGADFRQATLNHVCWYGAMIADRVRLDNTYLNNARIRELVILKDGQNKRFDGEDLSNINLQGAILTNASFFRAKLNQANLQDAELSNTNFLEAELCGTTLTGASIQDWNVNNQTNLEDINRLYFETRSFSSSGSRCFLTQRRSLKVIGAVLIRF